MGNSNIYESNLYDEQVMNKENDYLGGFCGKNSVIEKDRLIIKENGKVVASYSVRDIYRMVEFRIEFFIKKFNEKLEMMKNEGYDLSEKVNMRELNEKEKGDIGYGEFTNIIITYQKSINRLKTNTPEFKAFNSRISKLIEDVRQSINDEYFQAFVISSAYMVLVNPGIIKAIFNKDTTYTTEDALELFKKFTSKDVLKQNARITSEYILNAPTDFLKKLEKNGYLESEKVFRYTPKRLKECKKDLNYESRFICTRSCISAYLYGLIDLKHLQKDFNVNELFDIRYLKKNNDLNLDSTGEHTVHFIDNEDEKLNYKDHGKMIMEIVEKVEPPVTATTGFWNYYINGIFSLEQIVKLCMDGYISVDEICEEYLENHKILNELDDKEYSQGEKMNKIFDDEKVFRFFNPELTAALIDSEYYTDKAKIFIKKYLRKMYEQHNMDFSEEIFKGSLKNYDDDQYDIQTRISKIIDLYNDDIIGVVQLKNENIDSSIIHDIFIRKKEDSIFVVDLYNNNLISQDEIFEELDEDKIFELINIGINPNIISEFYSTREIVDIVVNKKIIEGIDLSCLASNIDIAEIKRMYQPSKFKNQNNKTYLVDSLKYDDLNMLVAYGLLTVEQANEIDQEYDYNLKIEMLMENGLIVGDKNGIRVKPNEGNGKSNGGTYGSGKIDDKDKQALYVTLDDEYIEFELSSDVLKNYNLVVMPKLKIAIMEPNEEGTGASYVMSIKLALDQISNEQLPNDEKQEDPLKAYKNRTGIRSIPGMENANHLESWGYNLVKKMQKIHPNIETLIYSKDQDENAKFSHKTKLKLIQDRIYNEYLKGKLLKRETL